MKKITMTITLEPDTTEFLQRRLADTGMSEDRSRYINNLIRQHRDSRGVSPESCCEGNELAPFSDEEMLELHQESQIPAAD